MDRSHSARAARSGPGAAHTCCRNRAPGNGPARRGNRPLTLDQLLQHQLADHATSSEMRFVSPSAAPASSSCSRSRAITDGATVRIGLLLHVGFQHTEMIEQATIIYMHVKTSPRGASGFIDRLWPCAGQMTQDALDHPRRRVVAGSAAPLRGVRVGDDRADMSRPGRDVAHELFDFAPQAAQPYLQYPPPLSGGQLNRGKFRAQPRQPYR